jgi:hypothetical protein
MAGAAVLFSDALCMLLMYRNLIKSYLYVVSGNQVSMCSQPEWAFTGMAGAAALLLSLSARGCML